MVLLILLSPGSIRKLFYQTTAVSHFPSVRISYTSTNIAFVTRDERLRVEGKYFQDFL